MIPIIMDVMNTYQEKGYNLIASVTSVVTFIFFITPTDLRYNGAQITGVFNLPECFSSNVTDTITLNIQGKI